MFCVFRELSGLSEVRNTDFFVFVFVFCVFHEQDRIRADQESYLQQHPEIASMLNGFIRAVVGRKPADVFEFARQHFAGNRDRWVSPVVHHFRTVPKFLGTTNLSLVWNMFCTGTGVTAVVL